MVGSDMRVGWSEVACHNPPPITVVKIRGEDNMGMLGGIIGGLVAGYVLFKFVPIPLWAKVGLTGIVAAIVTSMLPI